MSGKTEDIIMNDLKLLSFTSDVGIIEKNDFDDITLKIKMPPFKADYSFFGDGGFETDEYFVIEYSTLGWRRPSIYRQPCIAGIDSEGKSYAFVTYDDLIGDGRRYTVVAKTEKQAFEKIRFTFVHGKRPEIVFNIHAMYTCSYDELPVYCKGCITDTAKDFSVIDLTDRYNSELYGKDYDIRLGGGRFFDKEEISLCNIPFKVKTEGKNCIAPPPPPAENDEIIDNFGAKAKRRLCRPVSRDGETVVELMRPVTEIFFLMSISGKRYQRCGFATGTTILGAYGNEVTVPLFINDIEGFAVEIVYADGRHDLALPMNLSVGKHGMTGDVSLYALPADGSIVEKIIFRNRHLDNDLSLIALTVNESKDRLFENLLIPDSHDVIEHQIDIERYIKLEGDRLTLKNGAILMSFDLSRGLYLDTFENKFTPNMWFTPDAMLKARCGVSFFSDIVCEDCKVDGESVSILLLRDGIRYTVKATFEGENDILWNVTAENMTDAEIARSVVFPYISGVAYNSFEDGWYFVPKYQNINSNETVYVYEESAPSFPMQFFDVYSKDEQGGFAVTTRERELVVRKYALEKNKSISCFVEYPEMYCKIAAGGSFVCSPTLISAHAGDWRESFNIYKKWLDSWYEPYHCQDKQWYRECFWLLAEITDFFETREIYKFPLWYDKENKEFNYLKILEEQKKISGYYPDILHMWKWALRKLGSDDASDDGRYTHYWGNYSQLEYSEYDGLENFRGALHEFMEKTGVYSSVYLHPTLLTSVLPQFKQYEHLMVETEYGRNINIGDAYRMCHANDEWRDYILKMYPRVYEELKVPILYVDEFSLRVENRCYGKGHGHEVPSNLLKTDRNFITRLKDVMPHDVVLYGEYAAVDVNARYIDCNISYSIIDTVVEMIETAWSGCDGDDTFSRVLTDMYRFAFPKIVQLNLPMAMRNLSWHPQKFTFFNGEAIYDSLWDLEESAGHEFICKAFGLKKKYSDCFSSDYPETMVETMSPAICANRFPGNGREVYTIYNRAYNTFRGKALRVKHTDGATYYDAWNDKELDVSVKGGYAEISLEVHAQSIGCIAINYN